jgi:hypothetical protein
MLSSQEDVSSAFLAVCIRCGRQDSVVARCAECGGAVILTRESQAVRESSPDLDRALHLPGLDEPPRRIARGTLPPIATTTARAPATEASDADQVANGISTTVAGIPSTWTSAPRSHAVRCR